ncbi:MAG: carbohydrate-binding family 9-like protein [Smithellaceae bacterium]
MTDQNYSVLWTSEVPELRGLWDGDIWRRTRPLQVGCVRPEGGPHQPRTLCKLLYNDECLFGIFRVEDQYVRCIHRQFQSDVWKDSCVEMFVQPNGCRGYFNFEFNCGGALLASYVTREARVAGKLAEFIPLAQEDDMQIRRAASLPPVVEPEITEPLVWILEFSLPFSVLEKQIGPRGPVKDQVWRANFYKCGNETSHPHWLSWMPLSARNFHEPASFGTITFA